VIEMTQADRIRRFAIDRYVALARADGRSEITIRAGDVHKSMRLTNALPAVCSALGSDKFKMSAGLTPVSRIGPPNGANVYFQFRLTPVPLPQQRAVFPAKLASTPVPNSDLSESIVLVSCVKSKQSRPTTARSLYTSAWFCKTRDLVEASGARWFVLSALYGLVEPEAEIAPYDYTLNDLGVAERRHWANEILARLLPQIADRRRIVMFAGLRYREFLIEGLRRNGLTVDVPMEGLTRGQQLAWLSDIK
jgi:hypothetical protein